MFAEDGWHLTLFRRYLMSRQKVWMRYAPRSLSLSTASCLSSSARLERLAFHMPSLTRYVRQFRPISSAARSRSSRSWWTTRLAIMDSITAWIRVAARWRTFGDCPGSEMTILPPTPRQKGRRIAVGRVATARARARADMLEELA